MKQTKKVVALLLCLVMVATLFGACGNNANSNKTPSQTAGGEGQSGTEQKEAGTDADIIVAAASLGSTMNPMDNTDAISSAFQYATYERLIKYGTKTENGLTVTDPTSFQPSLAEKWDISDDKLTYTFYLNKNAKFANGDAVTAEDVIWSLEYARDNVNSAFVFSKTNIKEMEAVDEHTVKFTLSAHSNMIMQILEMYTCAIMNKSQVEENGGYDWLKTNTAGSGPYEVTKYDTATEVVLTRRNDYWGEAPKNHSITYKKVAEESNRQLMLEKGDVDMALDIGEKNLEALDAKDGITVQTNSLPKMMYLAMSCTIAPFDNVKVRQAIAYALPYDSMVKDVMYNRASLIDSSCIPSVMACQAPGTGHIKQDLEKAKALLAEAGYPDGFTTELLIGSGFQDWQDCAVLVQDALKQIGITVTIKNVERAQFLEQIAKKETPFFINRVLAYVNDPGYLTGMILQSKGNFNYYNYNSAEFDDLYAKAESTTDAAERADYYKQIQELVQNDVPIVPTYEYSYNMSFSDDVKGYIFRPDSVLFFESLQK